MQRGTDDFDVVVVGGGAAGVSAAFGAAQAGAATLLVERWPFLGGAAVSSSVLTYCGFFTQAEREEQVVWGVGERVLRELRVLGAYQGPYRTPSTGNRVVVLDPEATKLALDRVVLGAKVHLLLHTRVTRAWSSAGRLEAMECAEPGRSFVVRGSCFVDASGDCALTAMAGGAVVVGDGKGGFQAGTLMIRLAGVPAGVESKRDLIAQAVRRVNAERDRRLARERVVLVRLPSSGDVLLVAADEEVDGLSAASLTRAETSAREQAWGYLEAFQRHVPGCEDVRLVSTGPRLGVRETRHCVGQATVSGDHVRQAGRSSDAVARGAWPIELHPMRGRAVYEPIARDSYYDIPYGAICARELENVWMAGRAVSADPEAYGSLRVMGTAFATGHAAGVAAAIWLRARRHDAHATRAELARQDARL
jgi:hypothetical protein